jgi:DNA-binding PadR family transcriptional regulator
VSDNNRRARFYRLTPAGRRQLQQQRSRWAALTRAINLIVQAET